MVMKDIAPPLAAWKSYEYFPGGHNYHLTRYDATGGPDGKECVWADDSMWTIDTPEQPHSILFLIHYSIWDDSPPRDIKNAEIRFRLRGENLALHGARCYFWVVTQFPRATRWHFTGQPLPISFGHWGEPAVLRLEDDPSCWHRSFVSDPTCTAGLTDALSFCLSYGFAFVGFSEKVTGTIGLADFAMFADIDPEWPYLFSSKTGNLSHWLTMSRKRQAVISLASAQWPSHGALAGIDGPVILPQGDYLVIKAPVPFAYLAFLSAVVVGRRDLRNALLIVKQEATAFNPMGGNVCFFVEHAASGTRWMFRIDFDPKDTELYYEMLSVNPAFWACLSGPLSLAEVLAGRESGNGYDYLGFMLVDPHGDPSGSWGISRFSLGPTIDSHWPG